jgi:peptide chain release factor 3
VAAARLQDEYNVACDIDPLKYTHARWLEGAPDKIDALSGSVGSLRAADREGRPVMLFDSEWALDYCAKNHPDVKFHAVHQ